MNGGNEYVPADQAIELLGEKPAKFYYHSDRGEIRTETPARPGRGKKNNRYLVSDILALRARLVAQRQKRKPEPLIDWMHASDLPAGIKLAQQLYDDDIDLAEAAVYESWRKNNPHITLAAFSPDRSEAYASIQVVPLPDPIILDVLSGKRTENSIQSSEIRSYNEPGEYTLLGTSAIVLKDRPELLLKLLRHYMMYWIDAYPNRFISRIYAQAVSDSGDRLASSLFMAPRYDLAGPYPSYMLDLSRPGRSKLIHWFQEQLKAKAPLPLDLQWPPVQTHVQPAPTLVAHPPPTSTPVRAALASLLTPSTPHTDTNKQRSAKEPLPDDYIPAERFAKDHGIPPSTMRKAVSSGRLKAEENDWIAGRAPVRSAFNHEQQAAFIAMYHANEHYHQCSNQNCPCHIDTH